MLKYLFGRRPRHLFVACFPKSGSTYLCKALEAMSGLRPGFVAEQGKHNDQDISARALRRLKRPAVIQQHTKGTFNNVRLLGQAQLTPVVHVRNLFDVVVSLHDHLQQEDCRVPTGYVHQEYWKLPRAEQFDYLIQVHLPWYFNFLVSWQEAASQLRVLATSYEGLMSDRPATLRKIADFNGLLVSDEEISRAIASTESQATRRNRGLTGRGKSELSPRHRDAIWRLAQVWQVKHPIWSLVGLVDQSSAA